MKFHETSAIQLALVLFRLFKSIPVIYPISVYVLLILFAGVDGAANTETLKLAAGFQDPGNEARPRAYWNWLNGAVSFEGLSRDLEEAKDKGLGGIIEGRSGPIHSLARKLENHL